MSSFEQGGGLWVAATPIGNLGDVSERLRTTLDTVDVIACEDTRHTAKLLNHLGLNRLLEAYHDHNETAKAQTLADRIEAGERVALVSDAGTPAISDPGFRLVRECRKRGLPVTPIPGPCALTAVLSASGLPTDQFFFRGFLKPKSAARLAFFEAHREAEFTLALYESTHRIEKMAAEMLQIFGPERVVCFAREITKQFETILTGPLVSVVPQIQGRGAKGEFTVLIAPARFSL
ncbi:MAG: 16S rRNA (cytidine(1402)-2'-O)-methyltransferase [Opitutales bacterium]